jgi:hypothetical protein
MAKSLLRAKHKFSDPPKGTSWGTTCIRQGLESDADLAFDWLTVALSSFFSVKCLRDIVTHLWFQLISQMHFDAKCWNCWSHPKSNSLRSSLLVCAHVCVHILGSYRTQATQATIHRPAATEKVIRRSIRSRSFAQECDRGGRNAFALRTQSYD